LSRARVDTLAMITNVGNNSIKYLQLVAAFGTVYHSLKISFLRYSICLFYDNGHSGKNLHLT